MDFDRFRNCLDADYRRLREVAARDLTAPVPSCPGWDVAALVDHVAKVYLHKVECMRLGKAPEDWPPDRSDTPPLALLDETYQALVAEFAAREPGSHAATWFGPDQSVGFWIRRMAQETVVHRRDAELALGDPTPAAPDLAVDGIAELLDIFLSYAVTQWPDEFTGSLAGADGRTIHITTDDTATSTGPIGGGAGPGSAAPAAAGGPGASGSWLVRLATGAVQITSAAPAGVDAAARVEGDPSAVLFWLWTRHAGIEQITVEGDPATLATFRHVLTAGTQ